MIIEDGMIYEERECVIEDLVSTFTHCLFSVMFSIQGEGAVCFPTKYALGYSDDGGMALAFGGKHRNFLIRCDESPPTPDVILEMVRIICQCAEKQFGFRSDGVQMTTRDRSEEFDIEVKMFPLQ